MAEELKPVPDPTVLTADALRREIAGLRELVETKVIAERMVADERYAGLEQRIRDTAAHLRDHIDAQVVQIAAALEAARRETMLAQRALEAALDAARRETSITHNASEKAIEKADAAYEKRLEALEKMTDTQFAELRRGITDLTEKAGKIGV